jgi:hypothetical protein
MIDALGLDRADYPTLGFKPIGAACDIGLTMPGFSLHFGKTQVYTQD